MVKTCESNEACSHIIIREVGSLYILPGPKVAQKKKLECSQHGEMVSSKTDVSSLEGCMPVPID